MYLMICLVRSLLSSTTAIPYCADMYALQHNTSDRCCDELSTVDSMAGNTWCQQRNIQIFGIIHYRIVNVAT